MNKNKFFCLMFFFTKVLLVLAQSNTGLLAGGAEGDEPAKQGKGECYCPECDITFDKDENGECVCPECGKNVCA